MAGDVDKRRFRKTEQRNPMEDIVVKLAEKMDTFMQDVTKRFAAVNVTQREPPRVLQVGEGSGVSRCIPGAIPIVPAQRPYMPTFTPEDTETGARRGAQRDNLAQHASMFADWQSMEQAFRDAFPFDQYIQFRCGLKPPEQHQHKGHGYHQDDHRTASRDYVQLQHDSRPHDFHRGNKPSHDQGLQRTEDRFHLPTFDGSPRCSEKAWVDKLDTSFQLDRVSERKTIKMVTSHLEDEGTHDCREFKDTPSVT